MSYNRKLPEFFPHYVDIRTDVQIALAVGWILAEGTAFAVTPNLWNRTYRLWMSESSYKVVVRNMALQEDRYNPR